jgi:hypothetical protein
MRCNRMRFAPVMPPPLDDQLVEITENQGWPSYVAKASLGTVPFDGDGSVHFFAPAGKVLYFQVLDADYNELQRMRSVVQLQPGGTAQLRRVP